MLNNGCIDQSHSVMWLTSFAQRPGLADVPEVHVRLLGKLDKVDKRKNDD
jgi:hypothetical protein